MTAEVRAALEQLLRVLRVPTAGFTGSVQVTILRAPTVGFTSSVQVTIHFPNGTAGKVAMAQMSDVDRLPE